MYLLCVYDVGRRCTGWREDCDSRANLIKHDLTDTHRLIAALSPRYMHTIIAERRERSERSEANNRDRGHLTQVLSRRPLCIWNTGCCLEHHFEESPFH